MLVPNVHPGYQREGLRIVPRGSMRVQENHRRQSRDRYYGIRRRHTAGEQNKETQEKEEGHADQVQGRVEICLEQIETLCTELVGTAPDDSHAETGVTMTHAPKLCGVTPPVGASVGGLIPSEDVERICVTRGVEIEERSGGAKGMDIEPLTYHCGAELVARGGKTLEPLGWQAFLDSASGVTGNLERLLERLRRHIGGIDVSLLKSGPCQV